jgi:hypothetical protein
LTKFIEAVSIIISNAGLAAALKLAEMALLWCFGPLGSGKAPASFPKAQQLST